MGWQRRGGGRREGLRGAGRREVLCRRGGRAVIKKGELVAGRGRVEGGKWQGETRRGRGLNMTNPSEMVRVGGGCCLW